MGYYCTVPQCTSLAGKTKNVKFHRFPRDVAMADNWNIILKRGKPYTKYSKVCSKHFKPEDYNVTTMGQWKTLSKDAVPSQNLPKLNPDGTVMVIRKSRTVKYREGKKDDIIGDKHDKWPLQLPGLNGHNMPSVLDSHMTCDAQDPLAYRPYSMTAMNMTTHSTHSTHSSHPIAMKPKKQDAIMQTDPVQSEEDDSQPNNSYSEVAEKYPTDIDYVNFQKEADFEKKYEAKDYTNKPEDYIPQTNEEYNKEAEKYALERKSLNGYEKPMLDYQKPVDNYQKIDLYTFSDKNYARNDYMAYSYHDSVEHLRNQQQNLQILQEQHRITENQNFFNENHIKQEIDINGDEERFLYEKNKEQIDAEMYTNRRLIEQQRLLDTLQHPVKQEPDTSNGCESVMQPQGSPYYQSSNHNNVSGGFYESSRPGPELLIAKQNALAAHTQLWQNTMKRPFFYSESPHYNSTPILHRYEDISRILQ